MNEKYEKQNYRIGASNFQRNQAGTLTIASPLTFGESVELNHYPGESRSEVSILFIGSTVPISSRKASAVTGLE